MNLFRTKAQTLAYLEPRLQSAHVLPQVCLTVSQWKKNPENCIAQVADLPWGKQSLIIRSSCTREDQPLQSWAGHYYSCLDVLLADIYPAIEKVIASYAPAQAEDEILIQPQLNHTTLSGVLFSHDPTTGAPYRVISIAEGHDTSTITAGSSASAYYIHAATTVPKGPFQSYFEALLKLLAELQIQLQHEVLDIEFAFDNHDQLYLFQVRPLITNPIDQTAHIQQLQQLERFLVSHFSPQPNLLGRRGLLGVMPDWNPAEIIGQRPRPLARSLYQEIVTDQIWAYQRHNYGYRNLRSFPLMLSLHGCPYIDVRVSFNSFLPADLPTELAEKLLEVYLKRLLNRPHAHDKVEFDILYSCYTLDLPERLQTLCSEGFNSEDCLTLLESLRTLTNRIIHAENGLWKKDLQRLDILDQRWQLLKESSCDVISRLYWLLEDCKRYGTLPFAGLARAGFIALQMLQALVNKDILTSTEYQGFLQSLNTVSSRLQHDRKQMSTHEFLAHYGHLRPGTYDILSARYDEAPERYFPKQEANIKDKTMPFTLNLAQLRATRNLLQQHQLDIDVLELFEFIAAAIEGREEAKFRFTRHLSEALRLIRLHSQEWDLSPEEASYLDIQAIRRLYGHSDAPIETLKQSAQSGQQAYQKTCQMVLPPLLRSEQDIWSFELSAEQPNYISLASATGPVVVYPAPLESLVGAIILIEQADPGFDWLFSHPIVGLITQFGGANSHMAIRAAEMGLPAVIGAGQLLFERWAQARHLHLDAANRQVQILA